MYLVSPTENNGSTQNTVENKEFLVSEVHRPQNSNFIEQVLIEKISALHRDFVIKKNKKPENSGNSENFESLFEVGCGSNSTARVVQSYLNIYNINNDNSNSEKNSNNNDDNSNKNDDSSSSINNNNSKCINDYNQYDPNLSPEVTIYPNSPLQRTEKNEKEIQKYRKARSKSGSDYNEKNGNENNENKNNGNEEIRKGQNNGINLFSENNNIITLPFLLLSVSFCSYISYLYGKQKN